MQSMVNNLINGNLTDAKNQARNVNIHTIKRYLQNAMGWSYAKSMAAASYLKTGEGFQEYCDAK